MATILAISSQVARGHVGLSAIVPALQTLGHGIVALPTILLSNHPGHAHVAGTRIAPDVLGQMLDALEAGGWLGEIEAVLTGYLPSARHVAVAADAVKRVRRFRPGCPFLCDPVLGDDPKGLYVEQPAAEAIRDLLLATADIATPNRFELAWLTRRAVGDASSAVTAARALGPASVLATSIPVGAERIANLSVTRHGADVTSVARRRRVPHGTGDLMSALALHHRLEGRGDAEALSLAVGAIEAVVAASEGRDELALLASRTAWMSPLPASVERL